MKHSQSRYIPEHKRIILVGNYGSGKTEISVNLALEMRSKGYAVTIADLDVVNPYFRCRDKQTEMTWRGIRVVMPEGDRQFADLPIIVPEIKGMLQNDADDAPVAIFDVGGNDVGARVLSAMRSALGSRPYSLLLVVNTSRPFTSTVEGCLDMKAAIEKMSGLEVTGLIANTHLMEHTTLDVIREGFNIVREVSAAAEVPIAFVTVAEPFAADPAIQGLDAPRLVLHRKMTPPWLTADGSDNEDESSQRADAHAGRTEIGNPGCRPL
jgi:hypothetical protein